MVSKKDALDALTDVSFGNYGGQMWVKSEPIDSTWTMTGDMIFTDSNGKDIKLGELADRMQEIEKRLSILNAPSPEKLEKHKMLEEAYKKYKFIEDLIGNEDDDSR